MKIPSPVSLGLPPKYDQWRPNQQDAIEKSLMCSVRTTALSKPTGSGKTGVALGIAILSGKPTAIVTNSLGLQNQYMNDAAGAGAVDLRGRANYKCDLRDDYTCEDGHAASCPYKGSVGCPSTSAEMAAAASNIVITNYDKWIATKKYGMGLGHIQQVIFDEGHEMPNALGRALQIVLHHKEIEETVRFPFLKGADAASFVCWKQWASGAKEAAEAVMVTAKAKITGVTNPKSSHVRLYTHMRNLVRKLSLLATANAKDWIVEEAPDGFQFDPIRPGKYAEGYLLLRVPRIVVISATLRPKTLYLSGMSKASFEFHEYPSDFDPRRNPLFYVPTARMDRQSDNLLAMLRLFDQIASRRRDRSGIVHTISYDRQRQFIDNSRHADRFLVNNRGEAAGEAVEEFKLAARGTIFVTPSVSTGYDFPMKTAEWQFLSKIPFPPPSAILKARTETDKEYPMYLTVQAMVQMCGRLMRSKSDQGETFIGDRHMDWFWPKWKHLAPKAFHGLFNEVQVVPAPPERLK